MNNVILFTAVALALYVISDQIVKIIERRRGAPLDNRTLVFFAIILPLALATFELLERWLK